jgi:hypothetical protein
MERSSTFVLFEKTKVKPDAIPVDGLKESSKDGAPK